MSRHTFRVGWKSSCPVWESLHRTVYAPAYATRRIRARRAASRWGSTSHVCDGMQNVRETHWPEPLIGFLWRHQTHFPQYPCSSWTPDDYEPQRFAAKKNPAGDIHVITHRVHAACAAMRCRGCRHRRPACRDIRQRNSGIWPFAVISGFFATCLALASTHTHNGLLC